MLSDPSVTRPPPPSGRWRAVSTVLVAAIGGAAVAYAYRREDHPAPPPAPRVTATPPPAHRDRPWALDACVSHDPAPWSPLDDIARAQASVAPARDAELRGVASDEDVIVTWTDRRVWLSTDRGATWGRVLDGPGRVVAAHADHCGRVVVVRAPDAAPLALGTRLGPSIADERWRALPAAARGAFLGLAVRGARIAIAARAIPAPGVDRDDAPAALVTTADRGATWSTTSLGDVAAAQPLAAGGVLVAPRGCPGAAPCRELRDGATVTPIPAAASIVEDPHYPRPWLYAPREACGAVLACAGFVGDALAPVEISADPPPIARVVVAPPIGAIALPAADDQDLIVIGPGYTRTLLGSAGFPAAAFDDDGQPYGLHGASLLRLDRDRGVVALFDVPGAPPPAPSASAVAATTGACPAATAFRTAARHNQVWLVPLAVIANDKLVDAFAAIESRTGQILATIDPDRARAAGAPALPRDVWMLGAGDAPACHGVVRGYYGASDDVATDTIVGAMVAGCGGAQAEVAVVDAAPGACRVATLAAVDASALPPDLAAHADGAYPIDDPRARAGGATDAAYAVRIPDDGRGFAHLAVRSDGEPWSSGWRWLPAEGASALRPEVADDGDEAITALLYDASGPRYALVDAGCRYAIASIGDGGALTRRATRRLASSSCVAPDRSWLEGARPGDD